MKALSVGFVGAIVGSPDSAVVAGMRRPLEREDILFIHACRKRGMGWQSIAQQLRRCVVDVRIAAGDLRREASAAQAEDRAVGRAPRALQPLQRGSQIAAALCALAAGVRKPVELAALLGVAHRRVQEIITLLIVRGLIEETWDLTPMGRAEALRLKGGQDA